MQMAVIADYFGTRRFATVRGLVSMLQMPVNVAAPLIAGWSFDVTGSYHTAFTAFAIGTFGGMIAVMLIRRPTWADLPAARRAQPTARASPATVSRATANGLRVAASAAAHCEAVGPR